jgi:hypothetical protein
MLPTATMLLERASGISKPTQEAMPVYSDCYGPKVWGSLENLYLEMGETSKAFLARGERLKREAP